MPEPGGLGAMSEVERAARKWLDSLPPLTEEAIRLRDALAALPDREQVSGEAEVATLMADLAAMTKARDNWHRKYGELRAFRQERPDWHDGFVTDPGKPLPADREQPEGRLKESEVEASVPGGKDYEYHFRELDAALAAPLPSQSEEL